MTIVGLPPVADTFWIEGVWANTMTPSLPHVPAVALGASHKVIGGPPATSIFLSLPPAKNPNRRLSGDQNGCEPPSVPASAVAVSESRERIQTSDLPSAFVATKARPCPLGETAKGAICRAKVHPSGEEIVKRTACGASAL